MDIDHTSMCLGKAEPRIDPRTLMMADFIDWSQMTIVPPNIDVTSAVNKPWGMMKNDSEGNCVVAGAGHLIMAWTANASGSAIVVPDADILAAYHAVGGPGDNGLVMLDFLNYWKKTGLAGHKIGGYVAVNPRHHAMRRMAAWLFGGTYSGYALPVSAQGQDLWDVTDPSLTGDSAPGSWGGHCVPEMQVTPDSYGVCTWGMIQPVTYGFCDAYCDESYAVFSEEWLHDGQSIAGFDKAGLLAQLQNVTG